MGAITLYNLKDIVHFRGVDHPESISVGPDGEAYTTGTGGQVYRLDLATNAAYQFASTAPRRMLGQVVDADGIAFDEEGRLWIACHRPDSIYVFDLRTRRLELFAEDWKGEALRGPTDVAFAGPNRDVLLAASLDNLTVHRFDNVGVRGLRLNNPKL